MSDAKLQILVEPLFGYYNPSTTLKPPLTDIIQEWFDAVNFFSRPARLLIALNLAFHIATLLALISFILFFLTTGTAIFFFGSVMLLATIYQTLWYHRYCSHVAFVFTWIGFAKILLWTNPYIFREESYALPHRIHHQKSDQYGDPYGPHLGYIGSYLAIESTQKINPNLSEKEYQSIVASLAHIGIVTNTVHQFRKTGSIESVSHYFSRTITAQLFWAAIAYLIGGLGYVMAWYGAIFFMTFLIREFNWRGHGGNQPRGKIPGWEFDEKSRALNQRFYGYLASEWHDNHHKFPFSANNGFLPGQTDLAFQLIKLLRAVGVIESYVDARPLFQKNCLKPHIAKQAM